RPRAAAGPREIPLDDATRCRYSTWKVQVAAPVLCSTRMPRCVRIHALICVPLLGAAIVVGAACRQAALTDVVQATRLASELRVQFTKAADAANRAVMADSDDASAAAAADARQATAATQQAVAKLRPLLTSLGYSEELALL